MCRKWIILFLFSKQVDTTSQVSIGLQQSYYSTAESGSIQVCVDVLSGDITGRSVSLNYTTLDGSAEGT